MNEDVYADFTAATQAIMRNRADLEALIGGKMTSLEVIGGDIAIMLDTRAGVDLMFARQEGLYGVASRVQWGKSYDTFTIRTKRSSGVDTELQKRIRQINTGAIYPKWTMQMYCNERGEDKPLSIGICLTSDLYHFIVNNRRRCWENTNNDGTSFVAVPWRKLQSAGIQMKIKQYPQRQRA